MNVAVILAGGTGTRVGASMPKQFLDIDGRSVIERSIESGFWKGVPNVICQVLMPLQLISIVPTTPT